ncbi:DUF4351 domain-containing protein [Planktothrix sp. FACHB-1355]|uniref:DUF4351 domain-containing protein n=1 Tax=Aerosakkonema funiforme FACHB-1375 TaxID=2949571 RepID=A0A926ZLP0_9CYAN|nr:MULTISPECIES: DUF4351 domain-containing protein [Oscillatoriales]MBD2185256.1 DUF4351 domain-containing protein [Aerosakkonema funiforme FACHB-1375]MBD3558458.1 DUF4351 domain-containing protein [Planktothrix sp. FACHB-1355]
MRQSPFFQEILQEGRHEGRTEEALLFVTRLLEWKFGEITPLLLEKIRSLSVQELENLGVDLLGFSEVTDLEAWLE